MNNPKKPLVDGNLVVVGDQDIGLKWWIRHVVVPIIVAMISISGVTTIVIVSKNPPTLPSITYTVVAPTLSPTDQAKWHTTSNIAPFDSDHPRDLIVNIGQYPIYISSGTITIGIVVSIFLFIILVVVVITIIGDAQRFSVYRKLAENGKYPDHFGNWHD